MDTFPYRHSLQLKVYANTVPCGKLGILSGSDAGRGLSRVALVLADVMGVEAVAPHELEGDGQAGLGAELEVMPGRQCHELAGREGPSLLVVVVRHHENLVVLVRAAEEVLDLRNEVGG